MKKMPEYVQTLFNLWKQGHTYQKLSELYNTTPSAISQLFRRHYPDIDFKTEGSKRSQKSREGLTEEEKLNLTRECKCGCGRLIPQFVRRRGTVVKNEKLYSKAHKDIYFIQEKESNLVKIGTSADPQACLRRLQRANPRKLRLLTTVKGDFFSEGKLHDIFASLRVHGEWFNGKEPLLSFIESIKAYQDQEKK